LSSHGQVVHTVLLADGTLVGYTGEVAPTTVLDGEGSVKSNVVFYATLSDTDNGHYNFTLVQSLDDAKDSNAIKLTFGYTATDSDGDTSSNSFSVTVADDKPVAGTGDAGSVTEGALPGGNENPHVATDAIATGSLNISWGADNGNTNQGGAGDRSVAFTNANVTAEGQDGTLSSHGLAVHTVLLADGTLVGYTGGAVPTATSGSNVVFYATLSDTDKGHYSFTLMQSLDDAKTSDSIKLTFGYTATDSDGDTSSNSFSVTVADDKPVVTGAIAVRADEGDIHNLLADGNNPPGGTHDGSSSQFALLGLGFAATVSGSVASTVSFGADGAAVGGGFSFTANATSTLASLHLTSGGEALSYTVVNNVIIGYVDNDHQNGFNPLLDRPVLSLALSGNGSFTFQQYDHLDNVAGSGNDLRSGSGSISAIDFGSIIQATDRDGDSVVLKGGLNVTIVDDVPKVTLALTGSITIDESGRGDDDVSATKAIANLFAGITGGNDSHMSTVYAQHNVVSGWVSMGADDAPGATSSLTLHIDNPDSGLKTTAGQAITLSQLADGTVIGKTAGGDIAFAIRLDTSGKVSIAQYMSLYNPDPSKSDGDLVNLSGKLSAVLSATDSDGDTVSKSVSIGGSIRFDDDGPSIGNAVSAQTLVEHNLLTGSGALSPSGISTGSVALNFAFGADGPAAHAVSFVAGSNGSYFAASYANNQTLDATKLSSGGHALSYSLSSDGMTLIAYTGSNSGDTSSWVFKVVLSQDASHASGAYNFTLYKPLDDVNGQANLSDIRLTFQVAGHDGDGDTTKGSQSFAIDVIDDVPTLVDHAAVSATVSETAINTPVVTTGSYVIDFSSVTPASANLTVTEGSVSGGQVGSSSKGGDIVLTSNPGTTFVITQMDIGVFDKHGPSSKTVTIIGTDANGATYSVTTVASTFSAAGTALEGKQLTSITIDPHDNSLTITADNIHVTDTVTTIPTNAPAETTLDLSSLVHASADGPMAWTVNAITAGTSSGNLTGGTGLTYNGAAITLASTDGHTITGSAGGVTVFTLTVDPTSGHATFDLYHAIDGGKTLPLDFSKYLTATDFDGDSVTPVSGSVTIVVQSATDNLPTISSVGLVSSVSESGLSGGTGTPGVSNVHSGSIAITAGDAPSTVTISGHTFNVGAAIANGDTNANIQGTYGTLHIVSVTATAINYTYTLTGATSGTGNHDDFSVKISDAPIDGESQTATLTFNISDDKPIASTVSLGSMLENDNATFTLTAGTIAFGADGAAASGAIHIDSVKATGDLAGLTLSPSMISIDAGHVVITPGTAFDVLSLGHTSILSIEYTLTDGDGSKTSGTFSIKIIGTNDAPTITLVGNDTATGSVTEAGIGVADDAAHNTATGHLTGADVDSPTLTWSLIAGNGQTSNVGGSVTGAYGTLSVDQSGNWT
ncbi:beta strand repeat-containing protein, partial [Rhizobium sp. BR 314]|uniref:beta strand repeat-containing protein n=1 Tax=Rhizobium sp. BR 314 TaxID=3040013 RepID=UPI0039BF92BD